MVALIIQNKVFLFNNNLIFIFLPFFLVNFLLYVVIIIFFSFSFSVWAVSFVVMRFVSHFIFSLLCFTRNILRQGDKKTTTYLDSSIQLNEEICSERRIKEID